MVEKTNKRIGLFVYDWGFYHYIKDFVIKFAEAGYCIDIFFKDWDVRPKFADTSDFEHNNKIRFFNFTTKLTTRKLYKGRYMRVLNKIAASLSLPRNASPDKIINRDIFNQSREIIETTHYDCFIGVEKQGLIWAGMLSEINKCPVIYFSLELFIEDNPYIDRVYNILDAERKYHKLSVATIIQDKPRANVLLKSNGVEHTNLLYLPVSAKGDSVREKSRFLQNKLHIDDNKKIILYFGGIETNRFLPELIRMAKDLDEDVILVIHGVGKETYVNYLRSIADKDKVIFSLDFVEEEEIESLVSSADIGIALYKTNNANDLLVAFSSSKVAYYMQCGIPMIAFEGESFQELVNCYRCVELINTPNEIPIKARKILENYDSYREQSFAAYQRFYNLDENFTRLLKNFEQIINCPNES